MSEPESVYIVQHQSAHGTAEAGAVVMYWRWILPFAAETIRAVLCAMNQDQWGDPLSVTAVEGQFAANLACECLPAYIWSVTRKPSADEWVIDFLAMEIRYSGRTWPLAAFARGAGPTVDIDSSGSAWYRWDDERQEAGMPPA